MLRPQIELKSWLRFQQQSFPLQEQLYKCLLSSLLSFLFQRGLLCVCIIQVEENCSVKFLSAKPKLKLASRAPLWLSRKRFAALALRNLRFALKLLLDEELKIFFRLKFFIRAPVHQLATSCPLKIEILCSSPEAEAALWSR